MLKTLATNPLFPFLAGMLFLALLGQLTIRVRPWRRRRAAMRAELTAARRADRDLNVYLNQRRAQ